MFFYLKKFVGNLLYKIGYLSGLTIVYLPRRRVYFGTTMREWRRREKLREKLAVSLLRHRAGRFPLNN